MKVGKCPNCSNLLEKKDIETHKIHVGGVYSHYAFVCKICGHIIGFAARESD